MFSSTAWMDIISKLQRKIQKNAINLSKHHLGSFFTKDFDIGEIDFDGQDLILQLSEDEEISNRFNWPIRIFSENPSLTSNRLLSYLETQVYPEHRVVLFLKRRGLFEIKINDITMFSIYFCLPSFLPREEKSFSTSFLQNNMELIFLLQNLPEFLQRDFEQTQRIIKHKFESLSAKPKPRQSLIVKKSFLNFWNELKKEPQIHNISLFPAGKAGSNNNIAQQFLSEAPLDFIKLRNLSKDFGENTLVRSYKIQIPDIDTETYVFTESGMIHTVIDVCGSCYPYYFDEKNNLAPWQGSMLHLRNSLLYFGQSLSSSNILFILQCLNRIPDNLKDLASVYWILNNYNPDWMYRSRFELKKKILKQKLKK